jgi:hypothetical protein
MPIIKLEGFFFLFLEACTTARTITRAITRTNTEAKPIQKDSQLHKNVISIVST